MKQETICSMALLLFLACVIPLPAAATKVAGGRPCSTNSYARFSINFTGTESSVQNVITAVDKIFTKIKASAKEVGLDDIKMSSNNYNISTGTSREHSWDYSGSLMFNATPPELAWKLLNALENESFRSSLNMNIQNCGNYIPTQPDYIR